MKVLLTGKNGYLGSVVTEALERQGHQVTGIDRGLLYGPVEKLQKEISGSEVIIHLAGASILRRWTAKNKKEISDSRIVTTTNLVKAINLLPSGERPAKFISASAVGIYRAGQTHDETSSDYDNGYIGRLVSEWEKAADSLPPQVGKTVFRIGVVLGRDSKTIKNLLPVFRMGLGGAIGTGKQAFPFIHEKDLAKAFLLAAEGVLTGSTYNLTAPQQINNADFTAALARKLKMPAFIPAPGFLLKLAFGQAAGILLTGPAVRPAKLEEAGFEFDYPTIDSALSEIFA